MIRETKVWDGINDQQIVRWDIATHYNHYLCNFLGEPTLDQQYRVRCAFGRLVGKGELVHLPCIHENQRIIPILPVLPLKFKGKATRPRTDSQAVCGGM